MLRTPVAVRAVMVATSGIVHAAAFAVVGGHASANGTANVDPTVEVSLVTPDEEPAPGPTLATEERQAAQAHPHAHTHPYPVPPSHDWTPHDPALVHAYALAAPLALAEPPPQPATVSTAATAAPGESTPRFTIVLGGSRETSRGTAVGDDHDLGSGDAPPMAAERVTTPARLVRGDSPPYPTEARAEGVEGDVLLEIVVDPRGVVTRARVLRSASRWLDEAALAAVTNFRFAPATLAGRAVSVRMRWPVEFRLQ
jgi:periplasmic protein TonB